MKKLHSWFTVVTPMDMKKDCKKDVLNAEKHKTRKTDMKVLKK